jgi:DNA-binding beta-propeller fold protein YncE
MMKQRLAVILAGFTLAGCGGVTSTPPGENPPGCFVCPPGVVCLAHDAIFVANTGSSSISAFLLAGPLLGPAAQPVCGSPYQVDAPPTALAGGILFDRGLLILSQPAKSISMYRVDYITGELTGPLFTITTPLTPVAIAATGNLFYVANAEGSVSAYAVADDGSSAAELPGSPFPAGAGPVAVAAANGPSVLYVANSRSNNVSGYSLDPATGLPTPLPGSPYPAGERPVSIAVDPYAGPNPSGVRLVLVANRLSNDVSAFTMSGEGSLSPVPGSPFPAGTSPSGVSAADGYPLGFTYVANSQSNNVSGYSIDNATGVLTLVPGSPFASGTLPSGVAVASNDRWVYAANSGSNTLSVFAVGQGGVLTPVDGSPFRVGTSPSAVLYFQSPE